MPHRPVFLAFFVSGFMLASWWSRWPAIADLTGLTPSNLGWALCLVAAVVVLGTVLTGLALHRWRPAHGFVVAGALSLLGFPWFAVAPAGFLIAAPLAIIGLANALCDVPMNYCGTAAAAAVREAVPHRDRDGLVVGLVPRFHGTFSLGALTGSGVGAVMAAMRVPFTLHLTAAAVLIATGLWACAWRLRGVDAAPRSEHRHRESQWRLLVALGVLLLGVTFAEGAATEWVPLAVGRDYPLSESWSALVLVAFTVGITAVRFAAFVVLSRGGRRTVVVGGAVAVVTGAAILKAGEGMVGRAPAAALGLALVAAAFWGAGVALGFPMVIQAAAGPDGRESWRVGAVAAAGYCSFLAAPPLVGLLAHHAGYLNALLLAPAVLAVSVLVSLLVRPLALEHDRPATGAGPASG